MNKLVLQLVVKPDELNNSIGADLTQVRGVSIKTELMLLMILLPLEQQRQQELLSRQSPQPSKNFWFFVFKEKMPTNGRNTKGPPKLANTHTSNTYPMKCKKDGGYAVRIRPTFDFVIMGCTS